jgi:predicted ATPase with chaperone activity
MILTDATDTICMNCPVGFTGGHTALVITLHCRTPYQTLSDDGLISGDLAPLLGELSLAYRSICFLDELWEF